MSKPEWDESATVTSNVVRIMPSLVNQYFEQGRKLLAKKHSAGNLHRFLVKTERIRYTLELFREIYGPSLERWVELLKPVHTALEDIDDCAAAIKLLDRSLHRDRKKVRTFLEKLSAKKIAAFEDYWRTTFDASGRDNAWVDYLSRPARQVKQQGSS